MKLLLENWRKFLTENEEVRTMMAEARRPRLQKDRQAKMASMAANDERGNIDWNRNDLNDALRNQDWEKATNLANKIKEESYGRSLYNLAEDVLGEISIALDRADYLKKKALGLPILPNLAHQVALHAEPGFDEEQLTQQDAERYENEIVRLNEFRKKLRAWRAEFTKGLH